MQNSGEKAMGCRAGEDYKDLLGLSREDNDAVNLLGSVKMSSKFINNLLQKMYTKKSEIGTLPRDCSS